MADLPRDPYMLLSVVNMKLRDFYPSLDALCDDLDVAVQDVAEPLETAGYHYDRQQNAFVR